MNPATVIGLLILAAGIALAAQDAYWRKREKRKADDAADQRAAARAKHDADVDHWRHLYREVYGCWERSQEDELDALEKVARLTDDLAIEQGRRAAAELELDLHYLMPTVAGERAKVADRGNVVPLRRGGA